MSADRHRPGRPLPLLALGPAAAAAAAAVLRLNRCARVKDEAPPGGTLTRSSPPLTPCLQTFVFFFLHFLQPVPPLGYLVCLSACLSARLPACLLWDLSTLLPLPSFSLVPDARRRSIWRRDGKANNFSAGDEAAAMRLRSGSGAAAVRCASRSSFFLLTGSGIEIAVHHKFDRFESPVFSNGNTCLQPVSELPRNQVITSFK